MQPTRPNALPNGFVDFAASGTQQPGTLYGRVAGDLDRIGREVDAICASTQQLLDRFAAEHAARADDLRARLDETNRARSEAVAR
ncbi:MAG: hypothetical protein AAF235_11600, partial [Planctomycetota bacterium]